MTIKQSTPQGQRLRLGEINYLNVSPLFASLRASLPPELPVSIEQGPPSRMNRLLAAGHLDCAPASSFEYLVHAEQYRLLKGHCISADGPVKSVLLLSPVPRQELFGLAQQGLTIQLTPDSASSVALLKVLWRLAWKLPEPEWKVLTGPGGKALNTPFLEIGDKALKHSVAGTGAWHCIDLAEEWQSFTGLPFVFAVWIVRRGIDGLAGKTLLRVSQLLDQAGQRLRNEPLACAREIALPAWLAPEQAAAYWQCMGYTLGVREQAGLILFGKLCRDLGLIPAVPQLCWTG
ncbi:MAG: menaquinone biosynthetic enzyme MqnA/MqnD family protein [Desulfohalobiaceae bacterium]